MRLVSFKAISFRGGIKSITKNMFDVIGLFFLRSRMKPEKEIGDHTRQSRPELF